MFQLAQLFGMSVPFLVLYSISLGLASKKKIASWVLYFLGLILTVISFLGMGIEDYLNYGGLSKDSMLYLVISLFITLIFTVLIYRKNNETGDKV